MTKEELEKQAYEALDDLLGRTDYNTVVNLIRRWKRDRNPH